MSDTQRVNQPGREEAVVRTDAHPVEHERPEEWGWHGETGKWGRVGAWFAVLFLLTMIFGNHEGRMEDLWLIGIALRDDPDPGLGHARAGRTPGAAADQPAVTPIAEPMA